MRLIIPLCFACILSSPAVAQGSDLITESTATVGRGGAFASNGSFIAGVVAVADFGARWGRPSGTRWGFSVLAGRDFPNEATLVGLRVRLGHRVSQGFVEASLAGIASSAGTGGVGNSQGLGASAGLAYYPASWGGLLVQLDVLPTWKSVEVPTPPDYATETLTHEPALSFGARLAGKAGVASWLGAALVGLLAIAFHE